ncbi:MAG: hypothetical protein GC205_08540 [Bacteroidetes bacterium]|nr:hypothetical protein [Bacteroidota bacterium]
MNPNLRFLKLNALAGLYLKRVLNRHTFLRSKGTYRLNGVFFASLLLLSGAGQAQETVRVMFHNLLNFPDPVPAGRADTFAVIADYVQADLLLVCELKTAAGADALLNRGLNVAGTSDWRKAAFVPDGSAGGLLQNLVFYRQDKLALYRQSRIKTHIRDISHYVFFMRDPYLAGHLDTTWLDVYVAHLKAGNTPSDAADRSRMVDSLRTYLDQQPPGRNIIFGGDFNVYSSTEAAYQKLIDPYAPIWLRDPINRPGNWSSNPGMADVHTQSTRTSLIFDDGSGGGIDDRFDFLLLSSPMIFGSGRFGYSVGSYKALGNTGSCLNQSILTCEPNPVPRRVRNALFYMSDHLPVFLDLDVTYPLYNGLENAVTNGGNAPRLWWDGTQLWIAPDQDFFGSLEIYGLDGRLLGSTASLTLTAGSRSAISITNAPRGLVLVRGTAQQGLPWSQTVSLLPGLP